LYKPWGNEGKSNSSYVDVLTVNELTTLAIAFEFVSKPIWISVVSVNPEPAITSVYPEM
jgi:hypothetical protein